MPPPQCHSREQAGQATHAQHDQVQPELQHHHAHTGQRGQQHNQHKTPHVRAQAAQNGALATGISGSGPSVFVVMKDLAQAERMKDWMDAHFVQNEDGFARVCKLDMAGARVTGSEL